MNPRNPRSSGVVDRSGGWLVVEAPPDMPQPTWAVLLQEALQFAFAEERGATSFAVPVDHAARLEGVLGQPWPGRMWPWDWSASATQSARRAADDDDALTRLLEPAETSESHAVDIDGEAVQEELDAAGFARRLLPAQADAVARLLRAGNGGNFSVPGSGKTTMTLASFSLLKGRGLVDLLLVVAPSSAYEAWTVEAEACFDESSRPRVQVTPTLPDRRADLVVYNYERLATAATRAAIDGWAHGRRLMIVFDEAHRAKRGGAGAHGASARDVTQLATTRFVLTGTPMPNRRADLAAIMDLAWPGHGERLADPYTARAERTWVRITKHDLGLGDPDIDIERIVLDTGHRRIYDALTKDLSALSGALESHPALASRATARLIAAAANPTLLLHPETDLDWRDHADLPDTTAELLATMHAYVQPAKLLRVAQYAAEHRARGEKLLI